MVCKLHVEALQCCFGRRSDTETLDEASDWLNTILQAVASQWTSLTTNMMMMQFYKRDDDIFQPRCVGKVKMVEFLILRNYPVLSNQPLERAREGIILPRTSRAAARGQNYPLSQSPVSQLSHRANSCASCMSAKSAHVAFEGLTQFSQSSLESGFFKDTLKKDLVCPELVDFSFVETKGAPVVRKIPNGFNLVVVCLFSGSGRHSDLLTIDRRPSWSQRLFNPVLVSSP